MRKLIRWALLGAALWALGLLPFRSVDVAKLLPVRTVIVTRDGTAYTADVGAGVRGVGRTLREALEALRRAVTGEIFFPTAAQVIVVEPGGRTAEALEAVAGETAFRPAAGVYLTPDPAPDPEALGAYLANHPADYTLAELRADLQAGEAPAVPVIREQDGGYRVEGPAR